VLFLNNGANGAQVPTLVHATVTIRDGTGDREEVSTRRGDSLRKRGERINLLQLSQVPI